MQFGFPFGKCDIANMDLGYHLLQYFDHRLKRITKLRKYFNG